MAQGNQASNESATRRGAKRLNASAVVVSSDVRIDADSTLLLVRLTDAEHNNSVVTAINLTDTPLGRDDKIRVTGTLSGPPKAFGSVLTIERVAASAPEGITRRQQLIKKVLGIDDATAAQLVSHFGEDLYETLDQAPERITEVTEATQAVISELSTRWRDYRAREEEGLLFERLNLSERQHKKIRLHASQLNTSAVAMLKNNPYAAYLICPDAPLDKAVDLAKHMGRKSGDKQHIEACVMSVLRNAALNGHTYVPESALPERVARVLGDPSRGGESRFSDQVFLAVEALIGSKRIARDQQNLYLPHLRDAELSLASLMTSLGQQRPDYDLPDDCTAVSDYLKGVGLDIKPDDIAPVIETLTNHLCVLAHDGGCTTTRALGLIASIGLLARLDVELIVATTSQYDEVEDGIVGQLLAPQPAGSVRMHTVGHALGLTEGGFEAPSTPNLCVIAQCDNLSTDELLGLLERHPTSTSYALLGDSQMNAPLGPGQPWSDALRSNAIPVGYMPATQAKPRRPGHAILPPMRKPMQVVNYQRPTHRWMVIECGDESMPAAVKELHSKVFDKLPWARKERSVQVLSCSAQASAQAGVTDDAMRRLLGRTNEVQAVGRHSFAIGDPVYALGDLTEIGMRRGDDALVEDIDTAAGKLALIRGGQSVIVPSHLLSRLRVGYVRPLYAALGQRYDGTVLLFPQSTTGTARHRGTLYSAAALARQWGFVLGNSQEIIEAIGVDRRSRVPTWTSFGELLTERIGDAG